MYVIQSLFCFFVPSALCSFHGPLPPLRSSCRKLSLPLRPQTEQQTGALALAIRAAVSTGQVGHIWVTGQCACNVATGLDAADLDQAVAGAGDGLADDIGRLGLALSADDVGLALLLGFFDREARALSVLLRDLLLFDGPREFTAKGHVCDGDVLERDVELVGALG